MIKDETFDWFLYLIVHAPMYLQIVPRKSFPLSCVPCWKVYAFPGYTGCPRMFYTQKCKILRIIITIRTIEFGILIFLSDKAILLAFRRILNQGNRPNKTENTWHYVKRVIFLHPNWSGKRRFYELFSQTHGMIFLFIYGCVFYLFWVKTNLESYKWLKLHVRDSA